jgi:hypothetical protein
MYIRKSMKKAIKYCTTARGFKAIPENISTYMLEMSGNVSTYKLSNQIRKN